MAAVAKPVIVVPDDYPTVIGGTRFVPQLEALGDVTLYNSRPEGEDGLVERIAQADVVVNIRAYCKFTESVLRRLPRLRLISVWGTGIDNIDLAAAARAGIGVSRTPATATDSLAEHALALMLAVARKIPQIDASMKRGEWTRGLVTQLNGKTLGIIGTGATGSALARLGRGIGMQVIAWTYHPSEERARELGLRYVALDELLTEADVISIHVKLTEESRGMIGPPEFQMMKPSAILINIARAPIVDQQAQLEALRQRRIAGAGLDVYDQEPIPPDHPLLKLDNVVLTPHSGGQTQEALDRGLQMAVDNIRAFLAGSPQNLVLPTS